MSNSNIQKPNRNLYRQCVTKNVNGKLTVQCDDCGGVEFTTVDTFADARCQNQSCANSKLKG